MRENNGSDHDKAIILDGRENEVTKKKGLVARFLAWIARGAEKAAKDGTLCSK